MNQLKFAQVKSTHHRLIIASLRCPSDHLPNSPNNRQTATKAIASDESSSLKSVSLSICTLGKACKKAGSKDIARFLTDVAAMTRGLQVESVGCLGECGRGPNILVRRPAAETSSHVVHHISTPADGLEMLRGLSLDLSEVDVRAMGLRLQGNQKAMDNDLDEAMRLYSQALDLEPSVGRHLILCNRSAVLLQKGMKEEALADAKHALDIDQTYVKSWIRVIDSLYSLERYAHAAEMFKLASERIASFKSIAEYNSIRSALSAKGQRV